MLGRIAPQDRRRAIVNIIIAIIGVIGVAVAIAQGDAGVIAMIAIGAVYIAGFALYRFATSHVRPKTGAWLLLGGLIIAELLVGFKFLTHHRIAIGGLNGVALLVFATLFTQRATLFSANGKTFGERIEETTHANREYRDSIRKGPLER